MKPAMLKWVVLCACVVSITACASTMGPITPGELHTLTGAEVPISDRKDMLNRTDEEEWVLVTFSSDDDYFEVARRKQMHLSVNESLCSGGKIVREVMSSPILSGPTEGSFADAERALRQSPKRFTYRTYFRSSSPKKLTPGGADPQADGGYNLRTETHDLCIRVQGGNMVAMSTKSGVAVFPRALVSAALTPGRPRSH
jgi:hypothetical protein